jgi:hypothetical protein
MEIKNPFTHAPLAGDDEHALDCKIQTQETVQDMVTDALDRITASLDPKYHANRPEVIAQLATAMVNAELLLMVHQSLQEGCMFLGKMNAYVTKSNLYLAKTVQKAVEQITEGGL